MSAQYLIVFRFVFIRPTNDSNNSLIWQTAEEDRHFSPNTIPGIETGWWLALTATKHTIAFQSKFIYLYLYIFITSIVNILFLDSMGRWVSRIGYPIAPNVCRIVAVIHGRPHTKLYFLFHFLLRFRAVRMELHQPLVSRSRPRKVKNNEKLYLMICILVMKCVVPE